MEARAVPAGASDSLQATVANHLSRIVAAARRLRRLPVFPIAFLTTFATVGVAGEALMPHDPNVVELEAAFQPPAWLEGGEWSHPLGRDNFGRDILSRVMSGARVTLTVAVLAILSSCTLGTLMGMISGYFGRATDAVIMRLVDIFMAVPSLALALVFVTILPAGLGTVVLVITLTYWSWYARIIRAETLAVREQEFVALARVAGCGPVRVVALHIFPNVLNTVLVLATLQVGQVIIFESALSFLGLGIQIPLVSWGGMVSDARGYLTHAWWLTAFPGAAIMLTCLSANLLGDWMRDRFDPKQRQVQ